MTRVWALGNHSAFGPYQCRYQCCTPHELSWRDVQAPNSNHSAHSWWPRWSTGAISFRESPFSKWEVGIPNAKKQYPVHQHTNTVFENLWDIMRYLSCQTKMATPSSELECDTYASMPTACQTKRPLSMTKWGLLVMLTISEIIYQPWPCTSSLRWICKILCTWNLPQWRCFVDFLRGNKTCQEILCAYHITLHYITLHVRMHA